MPTYFIDPGAGNDANDGLSFANRKRTIASVTGSLVAGDNVRIIANNEPTNIGLCTWNSFGTITLPAGETVGLYNDGAWTSGAATVAAATSTASRKEGANSSQLTVQNTYAGATKLASYTVAGGADLSAQSKINLWFQCSQTTYANLSVFSILLCSDTAGDVPVYSFRFPASVAPPGTILVPIVIDNGSPLTLATSISSITLSASRQIGAAAATVIIDNVFASKNVRLNGLISKNSTTQVNISKPEFWWSPRSVNANVLTVEQGPGWASYANSPSRGYVGITESADGYVVESLVLNATTSTTNGVINSVASRAGTEASPITFSGGWDRTSMSQQISGISWLRTSHGTQYIFSQTGTSRDITYDSLGFSRCENGIRVNGAGTSITAISGIDFFNVHTSGTRDSGVVVFTATINSVLLSGCSFIQSGGTAGAGNLYFDTIYNLSAIDVTVANAGGDHGLVIYDSTNAYVRNVRSYNNQTYGFTLHSDSCLLDSISCISNGQCGILLGDTGFTSSNNTIYNGYFVNNGANTGVTNAAGIIFSLGTQNNAFYNTLVATNSGNATGAGILFLNNGQSTLFYGLTTTRNISNSLPIAIRYTPAAAVAQANSYVLNWTSNEATKVTGFVGGNGTELFSTNDGGDVNSHYVYADNGTIRGTTLSARSPGICWQMNLAQTNNATGTFFRGSQYPLVHKIKSILCTANVPMTASLWVRRTDSTVSGNFVLRGYQINGVSNNLSTSTTSASLTGYEQLSIAFTPTQTGFVEFEMQAFASNFYATAAPAGILLWDDFDAIPDTTVAATSGDYGFIAQGVVVSTPNSSSVATPTETSYMFC